MAGSVALVIFDCDGVLVDSERLAVKVEAALLAELGWQLSEAEVIEQFMGRSQEAMYAEIVAHLGDKLPAGWEARFEPRYRQIFEAELAPVDGVLDALDRITLPSCVASSSSLKQLRLTLGLTGSTSDLRAGFSALARSGMESLLRIYFCMPQSEWVPSRPGAW